MSLVSPSPAPPGTGPRAIVFDLDGTLVDSVPDLHAATATFLAERGHAPLDLATVIGFVGNGVPVLLERVLRAVGEAADAESLQAALPRFNEIYGAAPAALSKLYPGVAEALAALAADGHALGVCTNKPEGPARRIIEEMGIAGFIAALTGGDSLAVRKPDPAPLRHTAGLLQAELTSVVYVGDSEVDAATAAAAGVPFVLFTEGYRKSPVAEITHQAIFDDFAVLPDLVAALSRDLAS
ncbi:phosphoglycolate phosphatase [Pelagibius marinus]|uniref:phosphoglycolate phosphatase n=1 Tax=Pelagibius marinus TaxID=2762760 RepID=UPI001872AC06|nr:phosphoglycolate phosphatase [Pelagibius marinus]